jgi:hypothetical protein
MNLTTNKPLIYVSQSSVYTSGNSYYMVQLKEKESVI